MRQGRWPGRAAGAVLLAALSGALLAACGSNGDLASKIGGDEETTAASTVESAPAAPSAPATGQTPEEATRSVVLRAEDFPYLKAEKAHADASEDPKAQRDFEECIGEDRLGGERASAKSPNFNGLLGSEYLEFSSEADVFATAADARRVAELLRGQRVYSCFTRLLQPALEREETGAEVELVSVKTSRMPFPDSGIPGGFGLRVTATVAPAPESRQLTAYAPSDSAGAPPTLDVYMDILIFVSGRFEVDLTADGSPEPVPASLERNLLRLLRTRAGEAGERLR